MWPGRHDGVMSCTIMMRIKISQQTTSHGQSTTKHTSCKNKASARYMYHEEQDMHFYETKII